MMVTQPNPWWHYSYVSPCRFWYTAHGQAISHEVIRRSTPSLLLLVKQGTNSEAFVLCAFPVNTLMSIIPRHISFAMLH